MYDIFTEILSEVKYICMINIFTEIVSEVKTICMIHIDIYIYTYVYAEIFSEVKTINPLRFTYDDRFQTYRVISYHILGHRHLITSTIYFGT